MQFSNFDVGFSNSASSLGGRRHLARSASAHTTRIGPRSCSSSRSRSTATAATALSDELRAVDILTGAIGGEYTAINSTIQELVRARHRCGPTSANFWIGAALGATSAIAFLLDPHLIGPDLGGGSPISPAPVSV